MEWFFRALVVIALVLVVVSLAQAMYFLAKDSGHAERTRMLKALTARLVLSMFLFALVVAGGYAGLLER